MADIVKLDETILGSAASEITFSGISQAYQHLEVHLFGRRDTAATGGSVFLRLNSDAAGNYDYQLLYGSGAGATASEVLAAAQIIVGGITGDSATAGIASGFVAFIPDYTRTAWQKSVVSQTAYKLGTASGNLFSRIAAGFWRGTAAITSVTLLPNADNFITNTRAAIYGYKASTLQTILGSAASEITISGIPQTGKMLRVMLVGRGAAVASTVDLYGRANADTGSNYDSQYLRGSAATASAAESLGAAQIRLGTIPAASATASVAGAVVGDIPDYARTAWQSGMSVLNAHKHGTSSGNLRVEASSGFWRNTAAITSLTFLASSGNLDTNTLVDVYVI